MNTEKQVRVVNPRTKAEFRRFYEILAEKRRQKSASGRYTPSDSNERKS